MVDRLEGASSFRELNASGACFSKKDHGNSGRSGMIPCAFSVQRSTEAGPAVEATKG